MERAGRLVGKLKLSQESNGPETRARAAWRLAAGKIIAGHTRAVGLVRGALVVEVEDIVWQRQLTPLRQRILHNLAEVLGEALVTDIDFRPMQARRMPQSAVSVRGAGTESIEDPVLEMLYRQAKKKGTA